LWSETWARKLTAQFRETYSDGFGTDAKSFRSELLSSSASKSVRPRFRIPDVTVVRTSQFQGEIFTSPPHLCIEVLSKKDTVDYMQEKIDDYLRFGVEYIWIINPRLRKGYIATKAGMVEAESGVLTTSDAEIRVPVAEMLDLD
jgi:Uma2 family endonuclease